MVDIINNIVTDKQEIKNQLGSAPTVAKAVTPQRVVTKQVIRGYDNTDNVFILNSASRGVLGQNRLGDNASTDTLYSVLPNNNIYREFFSHDTFIDTSNSTGTLDPVNETYTFTAGQTLQSEVVAKLREPIQTVRFDLHEDIVDAGGGMILGSLELGTTTFTANTASLQVSNDSGVTWYDANVNEVFTFTTTSVNDELKYRVTANNGFQADKPITIFINENL